MEKKIKLSLVGALLASVSIFSGCNKGDSGFATTSTKKAADGYIISLDGTPAVAACGTDAYTSSLEVGGKGALTFGIDPTADCTITVAANARIDTDNSGDYNATIDKATGFIMTAPGDAEYITPLTTLVVDKRKAAALLPEGPAKVAALAEAASLETAVKSFDPVAAASTVASTTATPAQKLAAQKLMVLTEVSKTAYKTASATDVAAISTDDYTSTAKSITELNVLATLPAAITNSTTAKIAIEKKSAVIQKTVQELEKIDTTKVNVETLMVSVSDGEKTLEDAVAASVPAGSSTALKDIVKSTVTADEITELEESVAAIDEEIEEAKDALDTTIPKLSFGSTLTLGEEEIALVNGTFSYNLNASEKSISNFYNITLGSATLTEDINGSVDANLSIAISSTKGSVELKVTGMELSSAAKKLTTTIPSGSVVMVSQTDLARLDEVIGGEATGETTKELVNSDLSVNVESLLSTLGSSNIPDAIDVLNGYLEEDGDYSVTIKLEANSKQVVTDASNISGTVTVSH